MARVFLERTNKKMAYIQASIEELEEERAGERRFRVLMYDLNGQPVRELIHYAGTVSGYYYFIRTEARDLVFETEKLNRIEIHSIQEAENIPSSLFSSARMRELSNYAEQRWR